MKLETMGIEEVICLQLPAGSDFTLPETRQSSHVANDPKETAKRRLLTLARKKWWSSDHHLI